MELTKKTTILLSPGMHRQLSELAARRGTSLGDLVREACMAQYGIGASEDRLNAVSALGALALPVGSAAQMKLESVESSVAPLQ